MFWNATSWLRTEIHRHGSSSTKDLSKLWNVQGHTSFFFLQWNYPLLECSMAWHIWRVSFHFDVKLGFLGRFVSSGPTDALWEICDNQRCRSWSNRGFLASSVYVRAGPCLKAAWTCHFWSFLVTLGVGVTNGTLWWMMGALGALAASSYFARPRGGHFSAVDSEPDCPKSQWVARCSTWVTHGTGIGRRSQNEFGHGFVFYMFLWNLRRINRLHGQMLPYGCGSQHWLWVLLDLWLMADLHLRNFNRRDSIQRKLKKQQLGITGINNCHHTLSQLIHVYCI